MEKEFVNYNQALKLKELRFNEPCFGYYYTLNGKDWKFAEKSEYNRLDDEINIGGKFSLLVPTFSQAFRWFREKYDFVGTVLGDGFNGKLKGYYYSITEEGWINYYESINDGKWYDTYEEAELECLKKLIEIVEQKNEK